MKALVSALSVILVSLSSMAAAQYREDAPEVITPPPPAPDRRLEELRASRAAYQTAGAPRIVVFLNRQLSDRLENDYDSVVIRGSTASLDAESVVSNNGRVREGAALAENSTQVRRGRREVTDDTRAATLSEADEWRFLDAFDGQLQRAGINLVDRNTAMRRVAAETGASRDKQTVEMEGIAKHADLMMTVLQTPDPSAPLGVLFRISVVDLETGIVRTSLTSDGSGPRPGPGRFVAGANGFEREAPRGFGITGAGANVAIDTIRQMANRW